MTAKRTIAFSEARTRTPRRPAAMIGLLVPALAVVVLLFGGGLALGLVQSLGHLPAAGMSSLTLDHFTRVLADPDFFKSLGLTLYLALTSTLIAAAVSVPAALAFNTLAGRSRVISCLVYVDPDVYIYGACYWASVDAKDDKGMARWGNLYEAVLKAAQAQSDKEESSGGGLEMRSA